ncbi:uncharacterized protein PAC_09737 [Phialocephala subalpina]|uniref:Uncharacterized protein n=1 Tax=Phialocephala subalpina TaxID=576137 RepID=A0A1L7X492_9HELO|nr:uncharacterized protein PAC_09737 [Phialocephala subalpina]
MHHFFQCIAILGAVRLGSAHVIATTTVFVDIFPSSTVTVHATASTAVTLSVKASAKAVATPIVNSTNTNTNVTLPSFPLNSDSLSGLNSLMNLILSAPDDILQAGDADVVGFYTNISSCLSNVTLALEAAASNLVPEISSLAHEVGSDIAKGASKATSFIASLTSDIPGAISTAKSVAKSIESKISSLTSEIPGAISTAKSVAKSIESKITSAAPALVTEATSLFHEATSDVAAAAKSVASELHLPFRPRGYPKLKARQNVTNIVPRFPNSSDIDLPFNSKAKSKPRQDLTDITSEFLNTSDIDPYFKSKVKPRNLSVHVPVAVLHLTPRNLTTTLSSIASISACVSAASDSNPLFQIGDCAFHIAELVTPASEILKLKGLIEGAGGAVKVVQTLGNAKDAAGVVKIGGQGVLDVLKGVLGIDSTIKACSFLVQ